LDDDGLQPQDLGRAAGVARGDGAAGGEGGEVLRGEVAGARGADLQDIEGVAGGGGVGEGGVERAVEGGVAADVDLVVLRAGGGAVEVDVHHAGGGLRVVAGDGDGAGRGAGVEVAAVR